MHILKAQIVFCIALCHKLTVWHNCHITLYQKGRTSVGLFCSRLNHIITGLRLWQVKGQRKESRGEQWNTKSDSYDKVYMVVVLLKWKECCISKTTFVTFNFRFLAYFLYAIPCCTWTKRNTVDVFDKALLWLLTGERFCSEVAEQLDLIFQCLSNAMYTPHSSWKYLYL